MSIVSKCASMNSGGDGVGGGGTILLLIHLCSIFTITQIRIQLDGWCCACVRCACLLYFECSDTMRIVCQWQIRLNLNSHQCGTHEMASAQGILKTTSNDNRPFYVCVQHQFLCPHFSPSFLFRFVIVGVSQYVRMCRRIRTTRCVQTNTDTDTHTLQTS